MGNDTPPRGLGETFYRTLLESTLAIPWHIDWQSMRFTYIGPQIEPLLGWKAESWTSVNDWAERIHPDDRDNVVNFCVAQSQSGVDHEADYRALKADGGYVWIRDVVHVIRDAQGNVEALVGFMFDISERRRREEDILRLQRELQAVAGASRRLEQVLPAAWDEARRAGQPLSLLRIAVDYLDDYRLENGALAADECLRRVAGLLAAGANRRGDVVIAHDDGFDVLLPATDGEQARLLAERCRRLVVEARLPNLRSPIASYVTVTVGVATLQPAGGGAPAGLVQQADAALAQACRLGRNTVAA